MYRARRKLVLHTVGDIITAGSPVGLLSVPLTKRLTDSTFYGCLSIIANDKVSAEKMQNKNTM